MVKSPTLASRFDRLCGTCSVIRTDEARRTIEKNCDLSIRICDSTMFFLVELMRFNQQTWGFYYETYEFRHQTCWSEHRGEFFKLAAIVIQASYMVIGATIIARQATNMLNIGIQPTQMCCLPKKQGNWLEQMVWCKQNTHTHIQVFKWALMFYRHDLLSKVGNHVQVTVQTHWYVISQNWPLPEITK